jgi:hypothetical protein
MIADVVSSAKVTVLHYLNHSAGSDWRLNIDTGEEDDAVAREVEKLEGSKLIAPPGARASYS